MTPGGKEVSFWDDEMSWVGLDKDSGCGTLRTKSAKCHGTVRFQMVNFMLREIYLHKHTPTHTWTRTHTGCTESFPEVLHFMDIIQ